MTVTKVFDLFFYFPSVSIQVECPYTFSCLLTDFRSFLS